MMKRTLFYVGLLMIVAFLQGCTHREEVERPNVIFIMADDLGAGDLACTGHPYVRTPNLDALAESGIRFERAYMAGSWCMPSRYGLMSGQFPARDFDQSRNLKPDEPNVTMLLKDAGYATGHFGKWHMNKGTEFFDSPADFGIDEHFVHNCDGNANTWTKEEKNAETWRAMSTDYYVDMCIDFITRNQNAEEKKPFYVNLWVYPTHSYINPTSEQLAAYEDLEVNIEDFTPYQQEFLNFVAEHGDIHAAMQAYCADVSAMDIALGRLFDFLKKEELEENTLIVFTSDNGPGPLTGQIINESVVKRYKEMPTLLNSVGSASIYKERKTSLHDGGIRVPFLVSWPKQTPQGKVDEVSLVHGCDWLPTIASLCEVELADGIFDGESVAKAFIGEPMERSKAMYWTQSGTIASIQGKWKGVLSSKGVFKLYDILEDPSELNDLAEIEQEEASRIQEEMEKWKNNI